MENNGTKDIWKQAAIAAFSVLAALLLAMVAGLPSLIRTTAPYTEDRKHIEETLKSHDRQFEEIRRSLGKIEVRVHSNQIMLIKISTKIDIPSTLERAGRDSSFITPHNE